MKEFVYTCENCGSEYTITAPGLYQCQSCNNTFTVEDPEQAQAERLEQIRRKAEAQTSKQAQTIHHTAQQGKGKKKKFSFHFVGYILIVNVGFILVILYSLCQLLQLIVISESVSIGFQKTEAVFKEAGDFYFSLIAICVYKLFLKIEQNTRKGE